MKNAFVQRPVHSALPALVLGLVLLFPGLASAAESAGRDGSLVLAATGSDPVIPQAPERGRRTTRRPDASGAGVQGEIMREPAPYASPSVPPPYPTGSAPGAPAPYSSDAPPSIRDEHIAPPQVSSPPPVPSTAAQPASLPPEDAGFAVSEPEAKPRPPKPAVRQAPRRTAEATHDEDGRPRRTRPYDPKLVTDPSPATPYVVKEFEMDEGLVVHQQPTPLGVPPSPRQQAPSGAMATYSYEPPASTEPVHLHDNPPYPGTVGTPWPSGDAPVYTGLPPERIAPPLGAHLETPRPRPTYVRELPAERRSIPLNMELRTAPKALRPRR